MIDTIAATIPIDRSRIFASGFSNGGVFVGKLAVELSDVFAALAMSAGRIWSGDSGAPKRKIPIAMTIGSLDDRITEPAGITEIPANDSALIYMYKAINSVLGILELEQSYTTTETASTLTFLFSTNRPGTSGPSFSFTLFKGLTHNYPNGTNHPVTGAAAFWRFFEESTQVSDAPAERELPLKLDLSSVAR